MTEQEARLRLSAICSQAEHCSHEMVEKMRRWGVAEEAQARIMEYLTTNRFVDDERFARAFAIDKIKYNKWGRRKVEQAMWQKHIDSDIRQRVLDDISEDEYMAVLRPLLKSKRKSIRAANEYELNTKLARFGISRRTRGLVCSPACSTSYHRALVSYAARDCHRRKTSCASHVCYTCRAQALQTLPKTIPWPDCSGDLCPWNKQQP